MDEVETRPVRSKPQVSNEEKQKEFISYVQEQIGKMKQQLHMGDRAKDLTFFELNCALREYQETGWSILTLYSSHKIAHDFLMEDFENWYAEKFIEIRARENRKDMSAQKWASQKEIELMVRKEYGFEFQARKQEVIISEAKLSFLRRLTEN